MKSQKILWINPSFLDYRLLLYAELDKLCNNSFYILYSKERVPKRCHSKIQEILGKRALYLQHEKQLRFKRKDFANTGVVIPFPKGLYRLIKRTKPDLIIAEGFFQFTPWAIWYSWIHHIPLIVAYERTAHTERNCPLWRRLYRRFVGLFVNGYIANGRLTKEYLISQGVKAENIFTGGMCADSFRLSLQKAALSDKERTVLQQSIFNGIPLGISFIFVGRMIPLKGLSYLLQGWRKHCEKYPKDRLILVGDGPLLSEFKREYETYKSVIFTGGIDYSQVYKYYAVSDVFVIPTLEDNWSLVVPEAMACGLPVACSIYNGCYPELVRKDENGITFDPLDTNSLLTALDYFHHINIKQFGKRSIEIEKDFNPQNTAQNVMRAITRYLL